MSGSVDVRSQERVGSKPRHLTSSLFTAASAMSLLLCALFVLIWVRSLGRAEGVGLSRQDQVRYVEWIDGVLGFTSVSDTPAGAPSGRQGWSHWHPHLLGGIHRPSLFDLQIAKTRAAPEGVWRLGNRLFVTASMPVWFPVLITALLPARWLWVRQRSRLHHREGFCASCGYNLTANVSGVCPECGSTPGEARALRNRRGRRIALAAVTIPVLLLGPSIGRTAVDQYRDYAAWRRRLAVQQQYLKFTAPADQVVWTEDLAVAQRLATRADYVRVGNSICFAPLIKEEIPGFRASFNGGPALFLHGRRTSDGTERLVNVGLMALEDCEHLRAEVLVPISDREPEPVHAGQFDLIVRRWPDEPMTFRVGQPDPADPSHFTIGYTMNGQSGSIEGWLTGAKTIKLQVRDGPAETLKTSPTPISFFGGTWGGASSKRKAR